MRIFETTAKQLDFKFWKRRSATENDCNILIGEDTLVLENGKPKILFEGHIFWHQLYLLGSNPNAYVLGNENILYPTWDTTKYAGGSTPEQRGQGEWLRLEKAELINIEAALRSASWGLFQIMGRVLTGGQQEE